MLPSVHRMLQVILFPRNHYQLEHLAGTLGRNTFHHRYPSTIVVDDCDELDEPLINFRCGRSRAVVLL